MSKSFYSNHLSLITLKVNFEDNSPRYLNVIKTRFLHFHF